MSKVLVAGTLLVCVFWAGYVVGRRDQRLPRHIHSAPNKARLILAARMVGDNGYLNGWDVIDQNNEVLCSDPYVWVSTREIECEVDDK